MLLFFAIFLAASVAAASTGMLFKPGEWYAGLNKPFFTPPNWLFPVAWTYLYLSVAYAAARVAILPGTQLAIALFALQIALNTLWTPVFFGANRMQLGFFIIAAMWVAVALMAWQFFRHDSLAGYLCLPYLVWLSLAAALNWRVWQDNPATLGG